VGWLCFIFSVSYDHEVFTSSSSSIRRVRGTGSVLKVRPTFVCSGSLAILAGVLSGNVSPIYGLYQADQHNDISESYYHHGRWSNENCQHPSKSSLGTGWLCFIPSVSYDHEVFTTTSSSIRRVLFRALGPWQLEATSNNQNSSSSENKSIMSANIFSRRLRSLEATITSLRKLTPTWRASSESAER
jgi:hypothetical protein